MSTRTNCRNFAFEFLTEGVPMKRTHIILLIALAIVFAVVISMVGNYSSYESYPTALKHEGVEYHIAGKYIKEKGMEYNPQEAADIFAFHMRDREGHEFKVICNSDKPKDFELADEIVVVGKVQDSTFFASKLLTKCPSKYTDEEITVKDENKAS